MTTWSVASLNSDLTFVLKVLETYFSMKYGWEDGCFSVYAEVFSDNQFRIRVDAPTNYNEIEISDFECEANQFFDRCFNIENKWGAN